MKCPSFAELPPPPSDKTGWPWTESSRQLPERKPNGDSWPRITIVTPSFNQGSFIEATIRSILLQGYPNLEYFVLDGGSTDDSVQVIEKYSDWIDTWISEPDRGQSAAINRGLRMGSGSHATWINSDDMLCKDALFSQFTARSTGQLADDVVFVGDCVNVDEFGRFLSTQRGRVHSLEDLVRVGSVWRRGGYICQQEVLFPLQLALDVGGLNENNHYSMDYELWGRFFLAGARVQYTGIPFGIFRRQPAQKTNNDKVQIESTLEAAAALIDLAHWLSPETRQELLADLQAYRAQYPDIAWKHTGRLARLGLSPSIVTPMRNLKQVIASALRSTK